jgi:hypothetical protein
VRKEKKGKERRRKGKKGKGKGEGNEKNRIEKERKSLDYLGQLPLQLKSNQIKSSRFYHLLHSN